MGRFAILTNAPRKLPLIYTAAGVGGESLATTAKLISATGAKGGMLHLINFHEPRNQSTPSPNHPRQRNDVKARKYWALDIDIPEFYETKKAAETSRSAGWIDPIYIVPVIVIPLDAESVEELKEKLKLALSGCQSDKSFARFFAHLHESQVNAVFRVFGITAKRPRAKPILKPTNSNQISRTAKRKAKP